MRNVSSMDFVFITMACYFVGNIILELFAITVTYWKKTKKTKRKKKKKICGVNFNLIFSFLLIKIYKRKEYLKPIKLTFFFSIVSKNRWN